ncbi:hypothetical protein [Pseudoalteromonas sp.]|uniref:hypothetical protein n=1 Tax=Pseudoalteromonas sp. TaxID=53249 RepID=UPI00356B0E64
MPDKHFYFAIGASVGCGIAYYVGKNRHKLQHSNKLFNTFNKISRHWFLYYPLFVGVVGIWGLIPDILHFLGVFEKSVTRSGWFNIFFLHSWFEKIEDTNYHLDRAFNWLGQILLFSIAIGIMLSYVKFAKEAIRKSYRKG